MKTSFALLTSGLLVCLLAAPAFAQGGMGEPCGKDMATFCPDVTRGGGRMIDCLMAHEESVSMACKNYLIEIKGRTNEIQKVCRDDVDIFCHDVKGEKGSIIRCLKENTSELSTECQESMRR